MSDIIQLDEYLFRLINGDFSNAIFDWIMPLWRNKLFWMPLYVFLASFVLINFKKQGWYLILFIAAVIGVADTVSSQFVKQSVERVRPCNDPEFRDNVNLRVNCGPGYSFTSSHATNHFAVAFFLILTLGERFKLIKWPLLFWAFTIAFGQVYVGVHYPLDVVVGAFIGILIGIWLGGLFQSFHTLRINKLETN